MMKTYHTEEQLTGELAGLRQKVAELKILATEHERLEKALQESQEVLQKILESVTNSIPVTELDNIVTVAKPKNK
jgi:cell shape-determining protein MreC